MVFALSEAIELASAKIRNHHNKVAVIAMKISEGLNHSNEEKAQIFISALLHDCGSIVYNTTKSSERFNFHFENSHEHAQKGYKLLKTSNLLLEEAKIIKDHHVRWDETTQNTHSFSHIIHLADRISILVKDSKSILDQVPEINDIILSQSSKMFNPKLVDVFIKESKKENFWFDILNSDYYIDSLKSENLITKTLNTEELFDATELFRRFIDFRSPFTAIHSKGVSTVAALLGSYINFSTEDCKLLQIAGFVHDIGKLAIPLEILDKPSGLDKHEVNIIKSHTYYTYKVLSKISGFEKINEWAAFHHEKLDGLGYPFHKKANELSLGCRIMAVSDIFVALAEDRPYRKGMKLESAIKILKSLADNGKIDKKVLNTLIENIDEINKLRELVQEVKLEYNETML